LAQAVQAVLVKVSMEATLFLVLLHLLVAVAVLYLALMVD
jgi:hypothetical protein